MARIITYECKQCGSEVIVTKESGSSLSPIYCCGESVTRVPTSKKAAAEPKKTASKKPASKKAATRRSAAKKTKK